MFTNKKNAAMILLEHWSPPARCLKTKNLSAPVENGKSVSQTEFLRRSILETPSRYPTQGPALFFTKPPIDVKASITETSLMRAACSAWKMPTFHRSSGAILEPKISVKMALTHLCLVCLVCFVGTLLGWRMENKVTCVLVIPGKYLV